MALISSNVSQCRTCYGCYFCSFFPIPWVGQTGKHSWRRRERNPNLLLLNHLLCCLIHDSSWLTRPYTSGPSVQGSSNPENVISALSTASPHYKFRELHPTSWCVKFWMVNYPWNQNACFRVCLCVYISLAAVDTFTDVYTERHNAKILCCWYSHYKCKVFLILLMNHSAISPLTEPSRMLMSLLHYHKSWWLLIV